MNVHQNARLTPHSRAELVRRVVVEGQTPTAVAAAFGVTVKTVRKWVARFQTEGVKGLQDRSSRPHHLRRPTPAATVVTIEALRRQRWTGRQIAVAVGVSPATISRILRRLGLNRIQALDPATPVRRYEREHPGELIHIAIKKLGRFDRVGHRITGDRTGQSKRRGVGWEFVHVCIDDASRVAFSQILPDEKKESAVAFLRATVAYYANLGVTITRVMTDNGSCFRSKAFRCACRDLGLKHIRTKPYTPKTNGKAERFIQTALREWAYAQAYSTPDHRAAALPIWLHRYNWHRPHSSLKAKAPISRLALTEDNLLRLNTYVIHPTSVAVSREHRRAKTDRLDTALLKRVFLGWLRGEPKHCSMAAIPTLAEEDAKRPNREHESLVGERTRLVNRIKGSLVRLGIRTFKPMLRRAPEHLGALRTPEGGTTAG